MTRARTLLAAVVIAAATVPLTATPAAAHTGNYCGHGISRQHFYPWLHRVEFRQHYRAADGTHQHIVRVNGRLETRANYGFACNHR